MVWLLPALRRRKSEKQKTKKQTATKIGAPNHDTLIHDQTSQMMLPSEVNVLVKPKTTGTIEKEAMTPTSKTRLKQRAPARPQHPLSPSPTFWSEQAMGQAAEIWSLSPSDVANLRKLHGRLQDVDHWKNQPSEVAPFLLEPGSEHDLNRAEKRFRAMVKWRKDHRVDQILDEYQPPHPSFVDFVPTTVLHDYDKDGDPIYVERVGATDSWGLFQNFSGEEILRYAVYLREQCLRGKWAQDYAKRRGHRPYKALVILDLEGMNHRHLKPQLLPLLQEGMRITQDYYVGLPKKIVIIRAPSIFKIVWNVAQHFCNQATRSSISISNSKDYLQVLDDFVDRKAMPPCICPFEGKGHPGIYMPQRLEGGLLPAKKEMERLMQEYHDEQRFEMSMSFHLARCDDNSSVSSSTTMTNFDDGSLGNTSRASHRSIPSFLTRDIDDETGDEWSEENLQYVAKWWEVNNDEMVKLRQLKDRIDDVHHWMNQPCVLVHFLRNESGHMDLTEFKFRAMIEWRLQKKADTIMDWYEPDPAFLEHFPVTCLKGYDYDGDPVWLERQGVADPYGCYSRWGLGNLERFNIWIREIAMRGELARDYKLRQRRPMTRVTAIVDLEGFNSRHMKPALLPLLKDSLRVIQDYYPGMAKKIIVIRAPIIFRALWSIAQHFVDDNIKELIVFSSKDYLGTLSHFMDLDVLPPCIYPNGHGAPHESMPQSLTGGIIPENTTSKTTFSQKSDKVGQRTAPAKSPKLRDRTDTITTCETNMSSTEKTFGRNESSDEFEEDVEVPHVIATVARITGGYLEHGTVVMTSMKQ